MNKIKLNDGTEYAARWCGEASEILTANIITEQSIDNVAKIFANTKKNCEITFFYGEMSTVYSGFTKLILVNGSTDGEYIVSLRKG